MKECGTFEIVIYKSNKTTLIIKKNFIKDRSLTVLAYLKGQCHEMVIEVRPWSGSLALN
jgi:hypothetical protein